MLFCCCRGTIEIRTRSRCFADIFRATRTGADYSKSSPGRIRTVDPLFVRQVPSPLGHRTVFVFIERRPWDSNPQVLRPAVFKTASSPIRVTSIAKRAWPERRGQESNLRPSATNAARRCPEPDATTNSCYPGSGNAKDKAMLALTSQARGRGFEPLSPDSKSGSLPLADPRIGFIESAMRESNPPIQLGRLAPLPIGQWHSFLLQRKGDQRCASVPKSNSQGSVSARPLSRRLPSPIGLPFRSAPAAGIEPA